MRRLSASLIGAVYAVAFAQIASAADLPRQASAYPPAHPPAFSWSSCYAGVNDGAAWNHVDFASTVDPGTHFSLTSNVAAVGAAGTGASNGHVGFVGGGQVGCNWQTGSFVFGLEGDLNGLTPKAEFAGNAVTTLGPVSVTNSVETRWLATVRPRLGYAPYRSFVYLTGGVAFARFKFTQTYSEPNFPAFGSSEVSDTKTGWTIGAGYENAFTNNWSAKIEYLYARFDSTIGNNWLLVTPIATSNEFHSSASSLNLNIVRVGLNYKFM